MLPDETMTKAADAFLNADPVLGAVIVVLLLFIVFVGKMYRDVVKALHDEKDKRLDDVTTILREDAEKTRNTLAANTAAMNSLIQIVNSNRRQ